MDADLAALPDDIAALKAALAIERARVREVVAERDAGAAELAVARAKASEDLALIAHQKLRIARLERQLYGPRAERSERLIDQLALQFEEFAAGASEDELAAEIAVAKTTNVASFTRKRAERNTFPDHLPRERVVIAPPTTCECCGGTRLRKLGEDVTRTLEVIPRQWKVIETVREKFSCRDCEKISQTPAPFHVIARGWAGPSLLAMILFEKFGQHQPLNRQAERYAREGVPISLSTMADAVGSGCAALDPVLRRVEAHVMAAERLHGDDTTVPVLAKGKTDTGRCWVYVRDDRPFGGHGPPAAMFYYSRDRKGEHPQRHLAGYAGLFQADAFDGYRALYLPQRHAGSILEVGCWAHARRPFFAMADIAENARRRAAGRSAVALSPIAIEVVRASTPCSRSSGQSTARAPKSAGRSARRGASRLSRSFRFTCASSAPNSPAATILPRPSIISSSVAPPSPCSSMTDAPACRTMPPNARCAASLSGANHGCSAVPIAAVSVLPQCIA